MNINYFPLQKFADEYRVDYNALCVAVREALGVVDPIAVEPEEPDLSPEEMRQAGRPYCPICFTFGRDHSKSCENRDRGVANHVVRV